MTEQTAGYPSFIKEYGFERTMDEESNETLLKILDNALIHCNYEIPKEIQNEILHFTPFASVFVSDATDIIISLESYPMKPPNLERMDDILLAIKNKTARKRVADLADTKLQFSLDQKIQTMHPFWYYIASYSYRMQYGSEALHSRSNAIFILIRELLLYGRPLESADDFIKDSDDTLPKQYGVFTSPKYKQLSCALLSYWNQSKGKNLKHLADEALNILAVDYAALYQELLKNKSAILSLKIPDDCLCDTNIQSQREVMGEQMLHDILQWFNAKANVKPKGYVHEEDENMVRSFFDNLGLKQWDRVEKIARKAALHLLRKTEVMMMLYRLIGESINDDFQNSMYELYKKNRMETMNLPMPSYDPLCQLVSPPIKTISRARFKIKEDYMKDEKPVEGSVTDWVRCAIVVESDVELKKIFELLCKTYKRNIVRLKNKFEPEKCVEGGYRAVMVNLIWTNKENPKLKMIVEVQLILASYLPIRSKTHLFYKIFRANNWRAMADDFAKFSDI